MSLRLSVFNDHSFDIRKAIEENKDLASSSKQHLSGGLVIKRAEEVFPNFEQSLLRGISSEAINPNPSIPEYTFWKVIKHLASTPQLVKRLFVMKDEEKRRRYSLYIGTAEKKVEIEIDTSLPFFQLPNGSLEPAFCQINNGDIWPLLFEKACVKALGMNILFTKEIISQYGTVGKYSLRKYDCRRDDPFARPDVFDINSVFLNLI